MKHKLIRLNQDDYIRLFPLWKPLEIIKEFEGHSHCDSQIRKYYSKLKFGTQLKAFNNLIKVYMNDRPKDVSISSWREKIFEEIEIEREKVRKDVWESIEARQRILG